MVSSGFTRTTLGRAIALAALAVLTAALAACQSPGTKAQATGTPAVTAPAAAQAQAGVTRNSIGLGLYEVQVLDANTLAVAAAPAFGDATRGQLHIVDSRTLAVLQSIELPRRAFGLGVNRSTQTLYVGNTLDGSLTVIDLATRTVQGTIQLGIKDASGDMEHTRKVVVDAKTNRIFVTSPGDKGKVWIVDGKTRKVRHTLSNLGNWTAGAAYDGASHRLYVGQGGTHEILAIDADKGKIVKRFTTGDTVGSEKSKHFLLNVALHPATHRLFATDSNTNSLYVFDTRTGAVIKQIPLGKGALDVLFNPIRQEIYTTNRGVGHGDKSGTGQLTVIDAQTYAVTRTIDLPPHPNSLALSQDAQALFVTVKEPHGKEHPSYKEGELDSIVRIDLDAAQSRL